MFTGIIQFLYSISVDIVTGYVCLTADSVFLNQINIGDSVSIDGICLTVIKINDDNCLFQITQETIGKTNLRFYKEKMANVELALKYGSFVGGHILSGHVHNIGKVLSICDDGNIWIELHGLSKDLPVYKDSIGINGVSLTIAEVKDNKIRMALINETINRTNFNCIKVGDIVNIEYNLQEVKKEVHDDSYYMRLAIQEGEKGRFTTAPNPWVGSVIVKDGSILSVGHHERAGEPHAEVNAVKALDANGGSIEGSTIYVTLEPCCHYGRTPPCTKLLIEKKIGRVVIGILDPDTKVSGKGVKALKEAGIHVDLMQDINQTVFKEVQNSLRQYIYHRSTGKPYCTVKIALSVDNCYRDMDGVSKWITHEESRMQAHLLRASCQAIVVGASTVQHDDPELNVRYGIKVNKQPIRIVFDGESLVSVDRKVFLDANSNETIVLTKDEWASKWNNSNVKLVHNDDLTNITKILADMNCLHYLVEGGGKLQKSFFEAGLVNELVIFRSGKVFGPNGYQWDIPANIKLSLVETKLIEGPDNNNDVMERYLVNYPNMDQFKNEPFEFDNIGLAIDKFSRGGMVLIMDDEDRENEGDLVVAASMITEGQMVELINHTTGIICLPMDRSRAKKLNLPLMCENNTDVLKTAFTISVDAVGTTTGVSSKDRWLTARTVANQSILPKDLKRPGHMFPLIAHPEGFAKRKGHTEGSVALCKLANIYPRVAVIAEMQNKDGTMKRGPQCYKYAKANGIPMITIQQLIDVFDKIEQPKLLSKCNLLSRVGDKEWKVMCFDSGNYDKPHKVFLYPRSGFDKDSIVPVRIHSECFTGDVFKSRHCDCCYQLETSMDYIVGFGQGIIIFPSEHEGRGIGITQKIKAYHLQQKCSMDTLEANEYLGLDVDARTYDDIKGILDQIGVTKIELLTENPNKIESLANKIIRVRALSMSGDSCNEKYLETKKKYFESLVKETCLFKGSDPEIDISGIDASKLKVAFVYSMWHDTYVNQIRDILKGHLVNNGIMSIAEFPVPGSNEVPFKASKIAKNFDSIICIGILIKGDTLHFENVSGAVSDGIMQSQIQTGVPMINCILSCLNMEQVVDRITGDKSTLEYIAKSAIYMTKND